VVDRRWRRHRLLGADGLDVGAAGASDQSEGAHEHEVHGHASEEPIH
jgi:hypothetical protein